MPNESSLENQITYLYKATAKRLYSLALYSIGDQPLAEQLSIDAFASAFNHLLDKSDVVEFQIKSIRQLYLKSKKALISHNWQSTQKANPLESIVISSDEGNHRIQQLLSGLNYDERFMLLLFLQQKFSRKQIAQIFCIPEFIIKKRLRKTLHKAVSVWSQAN